MLDAHRVIAGVVERGVTEHLEHPWEGLACVPTLQGQRGSFGRQPSLAPSHEAYARCCQRGSLARPARALKTQTLCHSAV